MKPGIALAAALIAAAGLAVPVQAGGWDRSQRGGQQHGLHDSRPGWSGHGFGRDQWREQRGAGRYAPRLGYGYPRSYDYRPQYDYPRYYRSPPHYHYYRYDRDYDDDYGYYYYDDDYRDFDANRIALLISLPLRF